MLILLDRDGVINEDSDAHIKSPDEWHPIPGSLEAIAKLNQAGHRVIVVTNQSGIARGLYTHQTLARIHAKMHQHLSYVGGHTDAVFYCPHHPDEDCTCRKPRPGLLWKIGKQFGTDFSTAVFVGDALRDIQAAQAVHCRHLLVKTGKGQKTISAGIGLEGVPQYDNLADAVEAILTV